MLFAVKTVAIPGIPCLDTLSHHFRVGNVLIFSFGCNFSHFVG